MQTENLQDRSPVRAARIEQRDPSSLRAHPVLQRLRIAAPLPKGGSLQEFPEIPIITAAGIVLEGHDRVEAARRNGEPGLACLVYESSEDDALTWLLRRHRPCKGWNDFTRIVIALELEPTLRARASANQSRGGRDKGSSNLTEDERIDVRREVAQIAGVGVGNVTKVKQSLPLICSEIRTALSLAEIRIHRAWLWRNKSHTEQRKALSEHLEKKALSATVRRLLIQQLANSRSDVNAGIVIHRLLEVLQNDPGLIKFSVFRFDGPRLLITDDLLRLLESQGSLLA